MSITLDAPFLIREPADEYHAKAADNLSSHQLADFRKCPSLYRKKKTGEIVDEERPAYLIGRATHTLVLEGQQAFDDEFAVGGPINPKTGAAYGPTTKAFAAWAVEQGKSAVLTNKQHQLVQQMARGVREHERAKQLLETGIDEAVVRTDYCGVPSQIRMDWFDPHRCIVDLKTCDDLTWFEADTRRFGYVHQLAFYRAVLAQVIGVLMPVFLIGIEKKEPYRCGVWQLDGDSLSIAQRENEAAIHRLKRCIENDSWLTGYEEVRVYDAV